MLRRHIVLLTAIRPSDGDVKPVGPLGAFREEQAMSWHRVSPSLFLSLSSHTTLSHYTNSYTYSHPNPNFLQYTIQILTPTRNVICPSGAWLENRPHLPIRLAWNPKHVIVQWVGIEKKNARTRTHIHTHNTLHFDNFKTSVIPTLVPDYDTLHFSANLHNIIINVTNKM